MGKTIAVLKKEFEEGVYRKRLKDIYVDESVLDYQTERYIKALTEFAALYGERKKSKFTVRRDAVRSEEIIRIISTGRF